MDKAAFKQLISLADLFRQSTLMETIAILEHGHAGLAQRVRVQLERPPVQKSDQQTSGQASDIFRVELFRAEVDSIINVIGMAEVGALGPGYTTTTAASHFAGLLDTWNHYRFLLDEKHAA